MMRAFLWTRILQKRFAVTAVWSEVPSFSGATHWGLWSEQTDHEIQAINLARGHKSRTGAF